MYIWNMRTRFKKLRPFIIHFAGWALILFLLVWSIGQVSPGDPEGIEAKTGMRENELKILVSFSLLSIIVTFYINYLVLIPKFLAQKRIASYLIGLACAFLLYFTIDLVL